MPDPRQLPFLLELLEDDSPVVQEAVRRELVRYGSGLREELSRLPAPLPAERLRALENLLEEHHRDWLRGAWSGWQGLPGEMERLEVAFALLADFQNGPAVTQPLAPLLDQMAQEYRQGQALADPESLARFLFRVRGLRGARRSYYSPDNSNLTAVVRRRQGLPISLCCLYMLLGSRVGLAIAGCNFPGHFLARYQAGDGSTVFVDCFDGGRKVDAELIGSLLPHPAPGFRQVLDEPACAEAIIARVLRNLVVAYGKAAQPENQHLIQELLAGLPGQ